MPTLHLIDDHSTQACPNVMAAIRDRMTAEGGGHPLLLLGAPGLERLARRAGIDNTDRIAPPFGSVRLTPNPIRRWVKARPRFDRIHCWSLNALQSAGFVFTNTPTQLSLFHRPDPAQLIRLRKFCKSPWAHPIRVVTHTTSLRDELISAGITAEIDPTMQHVTDAPPQKRPSRPDLRNMWHAPESSDRVVALLSDHPSQVNAMDAAATVCLAGASLSGDQGQPLNIKLLMHPDQRNRQRAQYFLTDQSDRHRVVQDVRTLNPREILAGCDAALALGPNAVGLSLHQALNMGTPVITDESAIVDTHGSPPPHLHIARSSAHKDLAHLLHQALTESRVLRAV